MFFLTVVHSEGNCLTTEVNRTTGLAIAEMQMVYNCAFQMILSMTIMNTIIQVKQLERSQPTHDASAVTADV